MSEEFDAALASVPGAEEDMADEASLADRCCDLLATCSLAALVVVLVLAFALTVVGT